ncbi:MAG TPA: hypothetical protein P5556_08140 [Candidatus Gastranaerophilales bacterium]|nr:hypothetical protein [Candidatus Gastranaerophilales bacterium]
MKKSRGQSLIEFAAIGVLAVALIIFGLMKYGEKLADFFMGNDPEKTFNNSRTVQFENPEDLVTNVTVKFDGVTINPPVEKVIKASLASGTYIQTSGSAGRIAQMSEIMKEYVNEIQNIATTGGGPELAAFTAELNNYKNSISNGATGYLDIHNSFTSDQILEQKLNFIKMAINLNSTTMVSNLKTSADDYTPTLMTGNRKAIIEGLFSDLMGFGNYLDYFIDPSLYMKYLNKEKKDMVTQDKDLIDAIQADLASLSQEEKLNLAGLMKVYYNGGYSQASPSAYNGERLCSAYGGVMVSETECEISGP